VISEAVRSLKSYRNLASKLKKLKNQEQLGDRIDVFAGERFNF
jgi:hypothetical protein